MLIRKHDDVTAIFYSKDRRGEARLVEDLEVRKYKYYYFLQVIQRIDQPVPQTLTLADN
jgi:hypothetical protein